MQIIQTNIFGSGSDDITINVEPPISTKFVCNEPDSLLIVLIERIAKRYGLSYEEMKKNSDDYTCIPKHCLAYFLYIDLQLTTYKVAELIYGTSKSHANISRLTGRKMHYYLKVNSTYRFCYNDIKIVWNEIIDNTRLEEH